MNFEVSWFHRPGSQEILTLQANNKIVECGETGEIINPVFIMPVPDLYLFER